MKNIIKLIGIIALVAVIEFSFTACDDGSKDDDKGGGGTFTLTNIPSEYNGMYMMIRSEDGAFWGTMDEDGWPSMDLARISNGRASIPLWTGADDEVWWVRFNRTGTFDCGGVINTANGYGGAAVVSFDFYSVSFTNGSATKSWNDASIRY